MDLTLEAQATRSRPNRDSSCITPASLGILTFRARGAPGEPAAATDRRNEAIVAALAAAGDVLVTSTVIGGRYAIRLCILNHSSSAADVEHAIDRVATIEVDEERARARRPAPRQQERAARQASMSGAALDTQGCRPMTCGPCRAFGSMRTTSKRPGSLGRRGWSGTPRATCSPSAGRLRAPSTSCSMAGCRSGSATARSIAGTRRPPRRDRGDRLGPRLRLRPDRDGGRDGADARARVPGRRAARADDRQPGRRPRDAANGAGPARWCADRATHAEALHGRSERCSMSAAEGRLDRDRLPSSIRAGSLACGLRRSANAWRHVALRLRRRRPCRT